MSEKTLNLRLREQKDEKSASGSIFLAGFKDHDLGAFEMISQ